MGGLCISGDLNGTTHEDFIGVYTPAPQSDTSSWSTKWADESWYERWPTWTKGGQRSIELRLRPAGGKLQYGLYDGKDNIQGYVDASGHNIPPSTQWRFRGPTGWSGRDIEVHRLSKHDATTLVAEAAAVESTNARDELVCGFTLSAHPLQSYNGMYSVVDTVDGWPHLINAKDRHFYRHQETERWILDSEYSPNESTGDAYFQSGLPLGECTRQRSGEAQVSLAVEVPVELRNVRAQLGESCALCVMESPIPKANGSYKLIAHDEHQALQMPRFTNENGCWLYYRPRTQGEFKKGKHRSNWTAALGYSSGMSTVTTMSKSNGTRMGLSRATSRQPS